MASQQDDTLDDLRALDSLDDEAGWDERQAAAGPDVDSGQKALAPAVLVSPASVLDMAAFLGMDVNKHRDLLWIAVEPATADTC